jgi:5-methylcytosine-specific restriction endonuclease McrA
MAAQGMGWCRGCCDWLPLSALSVGVCREHANAEGRAYYAANHAKIRHRKAARERGLEPVPEWWRLHRFAEFGGLCAYGCGRPATDLDHVLAVSLGGRSMPSNLMPACKSCNSSKRASRPDAWIDRGLVAFPEQWELLLTLGQHQSMDLEAA